MADPLDLLAISLVPLRPTHIRVVDAIACHDEQQPPEHLRLSLDTSSGRVDNAQVVVDMDQS